MLLILLCITIVLDFRAGSQIIFAEPELALLFYYLCTVVVSQLTTSLFLLCLTVHLYKRRLAKPFL